MVLLCAFTFSACTELKEPKPRPYFSETISPVRQELRWNNGPRPKHLDPARSSAAPEIDVVRAVFEGLTEMDPVSLEAIPAAAERWEHSEDHKVWKFYLRENGKWSNGEPVVSEDFVRSWIRLVGLGQAIVNSELTKNIVGFDSTDADPLLNELPTASDPLDSIVGNSNTNSSAQSRRSGESRDPEKQILSDERDIGSRKIGFRSEGDRVLVVELQRPDKFFPRLVSNPIFRPVHKDVRTFREVPLDDSVVTNGAFKVAKNDGPTLVIERSETYWNAATVELARVSFISYESAEAGLEAYRSGELDVITNATFAPLALKLLEPFEDFRKTTFAALNFYRFNTSKPPFDDRRIRKALATSIERERLTEGELSGSMRPAFSFLPFPTSANLKLTQDIEAARDLLGEAGYPNGQGFPVIRLVINRNDVQQRVARSVARMWKQNLNLETEIIVKESDELNEVLKNGSYDMIRRGVVFPTSDEIAGIRSIRGTEIEDDRAENGAETDQAQTAGPGSPVSSPINGTESEEDLNSEEVALYELEAIPLYFPTSYSLIRPYVMGFSSNVFDAPLLRQVRIDNEWQPSRN